MGLDMYLRRGKKIPKLSDEKFLDIERKISNDDNKYYINKYKDYVHDCGTWVHWKSLLGETVGYWRKANEVHRFFVEQVQNNVDDCDMYIVPKEVLVDLYERCSCLLESMEDGVLNEQLAMTLLPTQDGFFFDSIDYDSWYIEDLKDTVAIIGQVLVNTDFENEYIVYYASW